MQSLSKRIKKIDGSLKRMINKLFLFLFLFLFSILYIAALWHGKWIISCDVSYRKHLFFCYPSFRTSSFLVILIHPIHSHSFISFIFSYHSHHLTVRLLFPKSYFVLLSFSAFYCSTNTLLETRLGRVRK